MERKPPSPPSTKRDAFINRKKTPEELRIEKIVTEGQKRIDQQNQERKRARSRLGRPVGTHGKGVGDPHKSQIPPRIAPDPMRNPGQGSIFSPKRYRGDKNKKDK